MATSKFTNVLDTEQFGELDQKFFIDLKKSWNDKHYIRITRRDQDKDKKVKRTEICLFEDDFTFFIEALSMILGRFSQSQSGTSA